MSAQSGIVVSKELLEAFSEANNDVSKVRLISVKIEDESLKLGTIRPPTEGKTDIEDFDLIDSKVLEEEEEEEEGKDKREPQPRFILFRLGDESKVKWMLISYVPDNSKVRQKMIYASSRATLTRQLGDSNFEKPYFATTRDELTPSGYSLYLRSQASSTSTMTNQEKELEEIKRSEFIDSISAGSQIRSSNIWGQSNNKDQNSKNNVVSNVGLGLNWNEDAFESLKSWTQIENSDTWVQFTIEIQTESIKFESNGESDKLIFPKDSPSYTFYNLKNPKNSDQLKYVFIYSCPTGSPVKSRLIYSSSSSSVSLKVKELGIQIDKKIETSDPEEIDKDYIISELNLLNNGSGKEESLSTNNVLEPVRTFAKPARPGRRK